MTFSATDQHFMAHALRLAEHGLYTTTPNPRVGCVVVRDGRIVGEGWHRQAGQSHAEALALAQAGEAARGATAYVTLEPCAHFGRTPPCALALIRAGVSRVVIALGDPNPQVAGRGIELLHGAGITTTVGVLADAARELNCGFISRMERGRPWVRLKSAASLDGRTALRNGISQWITGAEARLDGHRWRARASAILTGIGTVRADNPQRNVREIDTPRQPLRILVDAALEVDPAARLLSSAPCLIATASADHAKAAPLLAAGHELLHLPNAAGKVDLSALLNELGARGINEVHVEAGTGLNGSLLLEGCVDELLLYLAPMLIGEIAQGVARLPEFTTLDQALRLRLHDVCRVGDDLRVIARLR